jgi:hypothetical protein
MEARGERCAASCQGKREGSEGDRWAQGTGTGGRGGTRGRGGGEEGEKSAGWRTRTARVLGDNRQARIDMQDTICIDSGVIEPSRSLLVNFPADSAPPSHFSP